MRFLADRAREPFRWGRADCVLLAADAVLVMTGWDPARDVRGRWHDARSAAALLRSGGGLEGWCTTVLGPPGSPTEAQRGDVVLVPDGRRALALGVVAGVHIAVQGESGIVWYLADAVLAAWPVGRS
jgi:hypothetical protein